MLALYWQIGRDILERQGEQGWGAKVVDRLAADLCREFPEMKGFSSRNLKYMRLFAETWTDGQFVQQPVAQIPWGHNLKILTKVKSVEEREWYARAVIEYGWSRAVLVHQIESKLYQRQGNAITNFAKRLPALQSELAQQTLKDPYLFDFFAIGKEAHEQDIIGLILCKDKNRLVAEYALKDISKPVGISGYRLIEAIPEDLQGSLPSIEQIEAELSADDKADS